MWSSCMLILLGYPYGDGLMGTWGCWGCCSSQPRLTPAPPFLQNMPNVRDHDASVYLRLQGDALSVGGYESNPIFWEEVSGAGRLWGERGEFAGDPHQWGGCSSELLMAPHCPAGGTDCGLILGAQESTVPFGLQVMRKPSRVRG